MGAARVRGGFELTATVDRDDMRALLAALNRCERSTQDELRDTSARLAAGVVVELRERAAHAPTPAASLVAQTARVRRDRVVSVDVGGPRKVGRAYRSTERNAAGRRSSRKIRASAGTLLWGTESGGDSGKDSRGRAYSNRFGAPPLPRNDEAGYWIAPAVRATLPRARDAWVAAVVELLRRQGLEVTYGRA